MNSANFGFSFSPERSSMLTPIQRFMVSWSSCLKIFITTLQPVTTLKPMKTRAEEPFPRGASTQQSPEAPHSREERLAMPCPSFSPLAALSITIIIWITIIMEETDNQPSKTRIVTIVRVRPPLRTEDQKQIISIKDENTLEIEVGTSKRQERVEMALGPATTQRQVFEIIEPLLGKVSDGFNVSVLTYGQTGSGKTHTMFGSDWNNIVRRQAGAVQEEKRQEQITFLRSIEQDENYAGVIPRTVHLLFDKLVVRRRKFIKIFCSFLQIYNEQMTDLLEDDPKAAKEQKLLIHENKQDGIYVEGLNEIVVEDPTQCLELMQRGERNRIVRQTQMNSKSSRSHTIFTLLLQEVFPAKKSYRRMKINLCDLAGSEKIHKGELMTSAHFEELKNINLSLTTLGKTIAALATRAMPPYRESKLTRLLQDTLGGNTNTVLLAAIAAKSSCLEESLNTLKFLERARRVKGEVVARVFSDNPEMRNLEREISYLRDMLRMRGGQVPNDLQLRNRFKALQEENVKLKEMVDLDLLSRLKKENTSLRQKLTYQHNDALSDSAVRLGPERQTLEHDTIVSDKSQELPQISSQSNTAKVVRNRREDTKSLAARTEDSLSQNTSTFNRGTGTSMFPALGRVNSRGANKILERILEIERTKQENKLRLERELEQLERKQGQDVKSMRRK